MEACEAKRQKQVLNIVMCWVFKKDLRFIRVSSQKRENVMKKQQMRVRLVLKFQVVLSR